MVRRSTKRRPDEELVVTVGASDCGGKAYNVAAAKRNRICGNLGDDRLVNGAIANDSPLDVSAWCFELWLHQSEDMGRPGSKRQGGRQHELEGNEAHING